MYGVLEMECKPTGHRSAVYLVYRGLQSLTNMLDAVRILGFLKEILDIKIQ